LKKILFVHHGTGWGGAPISMINLIKSLDENKYSVHVLLLKDSIVSKKLADNNISYSIAQSRFYKKYYKYIVHSEVGYIKSYQIFRLLYRLILWLLSRQFFAAKELAQFTPDVIHLNSSVLTDWLKPSSKKGKVLIHIREPFRKGMIDPMHYFLRWQIKKYADSIVAISCDNAQRVGLMNKTKVIYNTVDYHELEISLSSYNSANFLYLGGAAKVKGFYTMVKALDFLDENVAVYFGGSYNVPRKQMSVLKKIAMFILLYGRKRKKAIDKMNSHPKARVIGMTYKVNEYLQNICCLVSPFSTPHFARPVIESYLYKKPAIGTDVKGMEEIIEHKKTGLIVKKENAKELAEAINWMASHPNEAKKMGEYAYHIAKTKFTQNNIQKFEAIYQSLNS